MNRSITRGLCVCLSVVALASCQDYDGGFSESQVKEAAYAKNFVKAFGEVDPNQDFNLATRATVNVSVSGSSNIKIYAYNGTKYQIVGDYTDVTGTQQLGVDVVKGTTDLIVTDGQTSVKTEVGGSASFGATRALYQGTYGSIKVEKDASKSKIYTREEVQAWNAILPEIALSGESNGLESMKTHELCNLNKVTKDFLMVSTGTFYLYPLFYLTNQTNTVGIYIKNSDNTFTYAPIYTIKNGEELQEGKWGSWRTINSDSKDAVNRLGYDYEANEYTSETFQEAVWTENTIPSDNYWVNGGFYLYDSSSDAYLWQENGISLNTGAKYKSMTTAAQTRSYEWSNVQYSLANDDGTLRSVVDKVKSIPVKVEIPVGTVFGMYLQVGGTPDTPNPTFYSQSAYNTDYDYNLAFDASGIVDPTNTTLSATRHACHVSNFEINGTTYLGFEDWGNGSRNSDMDLNDVMMVIEGAKPTTIDEDPTTASWVLACEDLGGTFDTDYNDVVFSVEHVSGRTTATVTPLAAGGTLASHIVYNSQDLGEIHQLLGASETTTGSYTPINVGSSRGNAGMQKTIIVDKDFSMSTSEVGTITSSGNMGGFQVLTYYDANSTPSVIAAPNRGKVPEMICLPLTYEVENDPEAGKKTTYTWAWPQELKTIYNTQNGAYGAGAYPEFGAWVNDYTSNTDWYKHPTKSLTVAEKKIESSMTSGGGGSTGGGNPGSSATPLTVTKSAYNTWDYGECSYLVSGDVSLLKNGAVLTFGLKDSYTSINIDLGTSYGDKSIKQGINSNTYSIEDATKFTTDGDSFSFYLTTWGGGDDTVTGVEIK